MSAAYHLPQVESGWLSSTTGVGPKRLALTGKEPLSVLSAGAARSGREHGGRDRLGREERLSGTDNELSTNSHCSLNPFPQCTTVRDR